MDESAEPATRSRYYLIQCLRLFAASFVVVFHSVFYVSTHGGQLPRDVAYYFGELSQFGILIFFAISGFVITSSVQRRTSGQFLWLRFLRIYPGFWLASPSSLYSTAPCSAVLPGTAARSSASRCHWGMCRGRSAASNGRLSRSLFYALVALLWTARSTVLGGFCLAWTAAITVAAIIAPSWGVIRPTFRA
jgi:exopolysaccharide production protein ExoZ